MTDVTTETPAPKKRRATRKPKAQAPATGRKTLVAAITAVLLAAADLFMTVRYGIKFF